MATSDCAASEEHGAASKRFRLAGEDNPAHRSAGTIRFELTHITEILAEARNDGWELYSSPVYVANVPWRMLVFSRESKKTGTTTQPCSYLGVFLRCDGPPTSPPAADGENEAGEWKCAANFTLKLHSQKAGVRDAVKPYLKHDFVKVETDWGFSQYLETSKVLDPDSGYIKDDTLIVSSEFTVESASGVDPSTEEFPFSDASYPLNDATLVVEGRKVHLNKGYLSVYSQFFASLFNSPGFAERDMHELPIADVAHGEFIELMLVIAPQRKPITNENVEYILRLADRFIMPHVLKLCEKAILSGEARPEHWTLAKQFHIVQTYPLLRRLKESCLKELKTLEDFRRLSEKSHYELFTDRTKSEILDNFREAKD